MKELGRAPLGASTGNCGPPPTVQPRGRRLQNRAAAAGRSAHSVTHAVAGRSVAATLPWLLFARTAGALADRLDRRKLMLWANLGRAVLPAVLAAVRPAGSASIWALYVIALMVGWPETLTTPRRSRSCPGWCTGTNFACQRTGSTPSSSPPTSSLVRRWAVCCGHRGRGGPCRAGGTVACGRRRPAPGPGTFRIEREQKTTLRSIL